MPSRVTGYPAPAAAGSKDTAGRPPYPPRIPPQPPTRGQNGPSGSKPPSAAPPPQPPYYGYPPMSRSGSYEHPPHPPPYPPPPPHEGPHGHGGEPKSASTEDRRVPYPHEYPYYPPPPYEGGPEGPGGEHGPYGRPPPGQAGPPHPPHARYPHPPPGSYRPGASPPSREGSYDHGYPPQPSDTSSYRAPPLRQARSSGSGGSASPHASPKGYPPPPPPMERHPSHGPPPGYPEGPPHPPHPYAHGPPPPPHHGRPHAPPGYPDRQSWPPPPPEGGEMPPSYPPPRYDDDRPPHEQYKWGPPGPYSAATYSHHHPHARRSLHPEYAMPRPRGYDSRQTSDTTRGGDGPPNGLPPVVPPNQKSNTTSTANNRMLQRTATNDSSGASTTSRPLSPTQIENSRRDEVTNMGCTCKKSKCLKLYCMCFGASVVCGPNCRCVVCHNSPAHEAERKEAVRLILARNPTAFDSKFKKDKKVTPNGTAAKAGDEQQQQGLAHKLGCKCRKSACTKKYCECFNAGVKCSAACRCMGCQNMPPGGFSPDPRFGYSMAVRPFTNSMHMRNNFNKEGPVGGKAGEPWMVDAAHNLAFLKHASPHKPEGKRVVPGDHQQIANMPSLVSSSDTTEGEVAAPAETDGDKVEKKVAPNAQTNALLMAAYAMTELHTDENSKDSTDGSDKKQGPMTPDGVDKSNGKKTAEASSGERKLRVSPKRKSTGANGSKEKDGSTTLGTPEPFPDNPDESEEQRRVKRTRIGTVERKKARADKRASTTVDSTPRPEKPDSDEEVSETTSPSLKTEPEDMSITPAGKPKSSDGVITPVTARCIDFRQMGVKENNVGTDSKVERMVDT